MWCTCAVLAGCQGGLGAGVEALALLVGLEVIPLVCDEAEDLLCGVRPPGELGEACGEKGVAAGSCGNVYEYLGSEMRFRDS